MNYRNSIFIILAQQIIDGKLLLILIWIYYWNYFFLTSNNQ